ncbi:Rne/Rng family ribonuclease [Alteribacillus sp. HJP-4]|uniref:Rne/Rng family ribonuclease n=1 Tax=Alteribacillus sp. HJP-4 TaxID=2775394 RepID=UPI0035CCC983
MEVIFNTATTERRAVLRENGKTVEIIIERPEQDRIAGSIIKGRVKDVLPGMQAAFVDIGREKNGFLYRNELLAFKQLEEPEEIKQKLSISEFLKEGQEILVQVNKEEFGEKGARLTENIALPGKYTVYMPEGAYIGISKRMSNEAVREQWRTAASHLLNLREGLIIRTICETVPEDVVAEDIRYLREDWKQALDAVKSVKPPAVVHRDGGIVERLLRDHPLEKMNRIIFDHQPDIKLAKRLLRYEQKDTAKIEHYRGYENVFSHYGVEREIERALQPKVWLKNGGSLMIEKTEALTVIDVNTGRFTGKTNLEETILQTNRLAAEEIAVQLRLRDISGIIVIDFIDMKRETDQDAVLRTLRQELRRDRTTSNVLGISQIGLVEMTRKKVRKSLTDILTDACPACSGSGVRRSDEALVFEAERLVHEHREIEEEAIVLEWPDRAEIWAEASGLLNQWMDRYPFRIYSAASAGSDRINILFKGTTTEAEKKWNQLLKKDRSSFDMPD